MATFELTPVNGRKSFYGKAKVIEKGNLKELQSYDTIVSTYDSEKREFRLINKELHSNTTRAHINAFFAFYGHETMSKNEMDQKYFTN